LADDLIRAANAARADKQGNRSIDILYEGALYKSSKRDKGFTKRYFALVRSSPGCLVYFEEQSHFADFARQTANFPELLAQYTAEYALGSISLVSSSSVSDVELNDGGKHSNAFQLSIASNDSKVIIFACDSADDRTIWKKAIEECCSGKSTAASAPLDVTPSPTAPVVSQPDTGHEVKRPTTPPKPEAKRPATPTKDKHGLSPAKASSPASPKTAAKSSAGPSTQAPPSAPSAPSVPTAPSAPSAPSLSAHAESDDSVKPARGGLLDQIQKGKKLKKVQTVVKNGDKVGKIKK